MKTAVLLLIVFTLFMLNTFAQDSPQWHLPDGAKARLGKGTISGNIAHSPDGTRLAVASAIGIWIYDTAAYQESALLTGHGREVESLAYSPDGNTIASAYWYTVRVWEATTGAHKHTITGHGSAFTSVVYSPDGNTLTTGSGDRKVRLWDATTGAHKHTITGHTEGITSVVYSPDGNTIASASWDGTVRLWDATTGAHKHTIRRAQTHNHRAYGSVSSIAYSPDGNTIVSGVGTARCVYGMRQQARTNTPSPGMRVGSIAVQSRTVPMETGAHKHR